MKNLIYTILLMVPLVAMGQTNTENNITTTTYTYPTQNGVVLEDDKIESISYYDGLGRPLQTIGVREGGGKENIVQYVEYDNIGMQPKQYLPWASHDVVSSGALDYIDPETLKTDIFDFYDANKYQYTLNPYSETIYELSPLNRIQKQGAPGNPWKAIDSLDTDHTIKFEYLSNAANEVRLFSVDFPGGNTTNPRISIDGYFPANELIKTVTKDENWQPSHNDNHTTHEFTNKKGQVVLKRNFNNGSHDTYYVYDTFGNLTFVLSPEASLQIIVASDPQEILDLLGYQYHYDSRNRLTWKKLPAKEYERIIYDDLDRPILTQDAKLRADGDWLFTKYDGLNRVIYTGIYSPQLTKGTSKSSQTPPLNEKRSDTLVTVGDVALYYSNNTYPSSDLEVLTINYYDSYIDHSPLVMPSEVYGEPPTNATQGLTTVTKVRVLGTDDWITNLSGYNDKSQVIYMAANNEFLDTVDMIYSQVDFSGNTTQTLSKHSMGTNDPILTYDHFSYDHQNRLLSHWQQINQDPFQLIAYYDYDELGQLRNKHVGGLLPDITYANTQNVDTSVPNVITKNGGGSSWNGGLSSVETIGLYGSVTFKVESENEIFTAGLANGDFGYYAGDVDLGFHFYNGGSSYFKIRNQGATIGNYSYNAGDTFRVERTPEAVHFYHNNELIYTHVGVLVWPTMVGDVGLRTEGASLSHFKVHNFGDGDYLQKVDFKYNVRGWLTDINDINPNEKTSSSDLFNFKINYTEVDGTANHTNRAVPLYNGNIAQTIWKTANTDTDKRTYGYRYDALNRITDAFSYKGSTLTTPDYKTVDDITYDKNGNILTLDRRGRNPGNTSNPWWDNLIYNYNGNQLLSVTDNSTSSSSKHLGFNDQNTFTDDFAYDVNGNMIEDKNKGISSITYNHLNLPKVITLDPIGGNVGGVINYSYDATGIKLMKEVTTNSITTTTKYGINHIYQNGVLEFMNHPEGYVKPITANPYEYVFQYKDHLGNIRLSYSDSDGNNQIDANTEIVEENNYYPFGLKQKGYNNVINGTDHPYGFQEQEEQNELGLNWIQFKWRNHDPAIGRFMNIDPLAEKYVQWTPYAFSGNRVIDAFELEGLEPVDAKKGAKHLVVAIQGFWGEPGKNKTLVSNTPVAVDNTGLGAIEQGFGDKGGVQVVTYNSSRSSGTIEDVTKTIDNFMSANPDGNIIMVGHSLGADNAINVANATEHEIELIVTLDIADYWDSDNAPNNVNNVVNIYQTNDFPGGEDVEGSGNTNVQNFNAKKSTHRSIDQDFIGTIMQMIQNLTQTTPNSTSAGSPASDKDVEKDGQ